ncbi:MAG: GxxExxY protein [Flavobacteriales bacterium]|nr:GxxExxY protein [Flavobacteriales bacterium]MCB9174299.1 GxxExxY protein [Flavobacteriales bacterium]
MNKKGTNLSENDLAKILVNIFIKVHRVLGPGLLESVYESAICFELEKLEIPYNRQPEIAVFYEDVKMDVGFRADIIVEDKLIIEIKSVSSLTAIHHKQLLTYLRLTDMKLGLLVNFNEVLVKDGITRIVNNL